MYNRDSTKSDKNVDSPFELSAIITLHNLRRAVVAEKELQLLCYFFCGLVL